MTAKRGYHHGNLKQVLLDMALTEVAQAGPDALSGRAIAKMAAVSPAAVYRHFPDKKALLTACAAEGFRLMASQIEQRKLEADETPMLQFRAVGEGYILFALERPNLFRLMFRGELLDQHDPNLKQASHQLDGLNEDGLAQLGRAETDTRLLSWALVHGLATLAIDSQLEHYLPDTNAERATALLKITRYMGPTFEAASDLS